MRYTLFLLIALLSCAPCAVAQPEVSLSEPFEEPGSGLKKLLQLSNGNTVMFQINTQLDVTVYNSEHKQAAKQTIKGKPWLIKNMFESTINGVYEINGEPVIFATRYVDRSYDLYRLRFDPADGKLLEEKIIGKTERYKRGAAYALTTNKVTPNGFFIEKDRFSDNYAVIEYNGMTEDPAKQLKLTHYSGTHSVISEGYYGNPGKFKYSKYIAMLVNDKYVIITSYGYNTEQSGEKDSRVIVSRLRAGEKEFSHELVAFTDDFKETNGLLEYNPVNGKIQLLTSTFVEDTKAKRGKKTIYYSPVLSYIDPESLNVTSVKPLEFKTATEYAKRHAMPDEFRGTLQNMLITGDGHTLLTTEATMVNEFTNGSEYSSNTKIDDIGICELDESGNELQSTVVHKSQYVEDLIDDFNQSKKMKGMWGAALAKYSQRIGNDFYSFDIINTETGLYILYNDLPENFVKGNNQKLELMSEVSLSNTVCHTLGKDPKKYFLFGSPDKGNNTFSYIQSSHFRKSNNTYATIIIERKGRKKMSRVAWLTFK